jgi:hypothetical protein
MAALSNIYSFKLKAQVLPSLLNKLSSEEKKEFDDKYGDKLKEINELIESELSQYNEKIRKDQQEREEKIENERKERVLAREAEKLKFSQEREELNQKKINILDCLNSVFDTAIANNKKVEDQLNTFETLEELYTFFGITDTSTIESIAENYIKIINDNKLDESDFLHSTIGTYTKLIASSSTVNDNRLKSLSSLLYFRRYSSE